MQLNIRIFVFLGIVYGSYCEEILTKSRERVYNKLARNVPVDVLEDALLNVPELIQKYGYPVEIYSLTTSDNYILQMHRIPYGKDGPSENRPVVYLQHGLVTSTADWVMAGPDKGLAYLLADRGYDVWMGNVRGNRYSRNHTTLCPDEDVKQFWNFSWHEIGVIDIPTFIDFALEQTQQQQLFYIGHSQGTTVFYVMCSERPEYNRKIRAQISLAPVAYVNHVRSPLAWAMIMNPRLKGYGIREFASGQEFKNKFLIVLCAQERFQTLCENVLFLIAGFDKDQLNITRLPILIGHIPAGSSSKQSLHYEQLVFSRKFHQYDYKHIGNMETYGSRSPPKYNLDNVIAPVYLFYSKGDFLSSDIDVLRLYEKLPNAEKYLIPNDNWNHLDYVFGNDAPTLVYDKIFDVMAGY